MQMTATASSRESDQASLALAFALAFACAPAPAAAPATPPATITTFTKPLAPIAGPPVRFGQKIGTGLNNFSRSMIPLVAEFEAGFQDLARGAAQLGLPTVMMLMTQAAKAVPIAGAAGTAGTLSGNQYEEAARSLGASTTQAKGAGVFGAVLTGVTIGAAMGSPAAGIGAIPGAVVGGLAALIGYAMFN